MAIWQFDIALVPAADETLVRTNRGFDWAPMPAPILAPVRSLLAAGLGSPCLGEGGLVTFGKLDGNRIQLLPSGPDAYEIWIAVDGRSDADHFCKLVCALAQALDCDLFSPEFETRLPAQRKGLVQALMSSRAWMFALDPSRFKETEHGWMRR